MKKTLSQERSTEKKRVYREVMQAPLNRAKEIGQADIVVGIPFYNEAATIGHVFASIQEGLREFYPQKSCVILCAGDQAGQEALEVVNEAPVEEDKVSKIAFLLDKRICGRGWALKAIMELAATLGADLALFEADMISKAAKDGTLGLSPEWVQLLLKPIKEAGMDFVIPRFNRHPFDATVTNMLAYPLISSIYGVKIREPNKGEFGLSSKLVGMCLKEARKPDFFHAEGHGIDILLTTCAITNRVKICQVDLGVEIHRPSPGKREIIFRETAEVLFNRIMKDTNFWKEIGNIAYIPAVFGSKKNQQPEEIVLNQAEPWERYERGFNKFCHTVYERVLPESAYKELETLAKKKPEEFDFTSSLWAEIIYHFLLAFAFGKEVADEDLLNSIVPLYQGRLAGFVREVNALKSKLTGIAPPLADDILALQAEKLIEDQTEEFAKHKAEFLERWEKQEALSRPVLPQVTYWEFIPGVPLLLPQEVNGASAETIYRKILTRYKGEFEQFVRKKLKIGAKANSNESGRAVERFMTELEFQLDKTLFPGNVSTLEGTKELAESVFRNFPHHEAFSLKADVILWLLRRYPPATLITKLGKGDVNEILNNFTPKDILALASWSEERDYMQRIHEWLRENAHPEHFDYAPVEPLVISHSTLPAILETREASALSKLTGRVVVTNIPKGRGGAFPKLRYLTMIALNIVEAESFGEAWRRFAEERKDFGDKVVNSIEGHWGREPFAAHNIFENGLHRELVRRVKKMAQDLESSARRSFDYVKLCQCLEKLADSYHLALTLSDGKFIPCSAWTWASYSFKGGKGVPTPLSLHVERDWASREFLMEYFKASGGTEEEMDEKVIELMGEGSESEDLSAILLGEKEPEILLPQLLTPSQPEAGKLIRFAGNPILTPKKEHPWESKYVLNPGVVRLNHKVHIVYRAVGEDMVSRLGLAVSSDGFRVEERLAYPIFEPATEEEQRGCEDPRLTVIGNRLYMLYTAYGVEAQISMASISVADFLSRRFDAWERHGPVFPGSPNKDAFLFPETFNGQYVMYHRTSPSIWVSLANEINVPWLSNTHNILMGPRSGMMWDGSKIGSGAPPIKTKYGWLLIYHGVDFTHVYALGIIVLDLSDPSKLLYRSPNSVLKPEEIYELGAKGESWVPNVVFTCGAVPKEDKAILEENDEILVYYGAADTVIGVAEGKISDLIPPNLTYQTKLGRI